MDLAARRELLHHQLREGAPLLVAYSGGVDSAYLAHEAHLVLGEQMLAVIADSPSLARAHLVDAIAFANEQRIPLQVISTGEMDNPEYVRNDGQRCFHCKDELFTMMDRFRHERG